MQIFKRNIKNIYLMGGFGNVLFQINFACNLIEAGYRVRINTYALKQGNIISNILGWTNHNTIVDIAELGILDNFEIDKSFRFSFLLALISRQIKKNIFGVCFYGLNTPSISQLRNTSHLFGYFHNENPINNLFVKNLRQRLDCWLSLKPKLKDFLNMVVLEDEVVVHVRGGDFKADLDLELNLNYYKNALTSVKTNLRPVLVLTNDIKHTEKVLGNLTFQNISQDSALADFIILMKSHFKVLANSTFSWWAAELGDDNSRIVEVDFYYPNINWAPMSKKQRFRVNRTSN